MSAPLRAPEENREFVRVSVAVDITLESESQFYTGISENLSEGGVFVATYKPRRVGELVALTLNLPGSKAIHTTGEVRWVRGVSHRIDLHAGMGLRFVSLAEEDARIIRSFLRMRDPLFFDEE